MASTILKDGGKSFSHNFLNQNSHCNNVFIKNCFAFGLSNKITLYWYATITNKEQKQFTNSGVSVVKLSKGEIINFKDCFLNTDTLAEAWSEE